MEVRSLPFQYHSSYKLERSCEDYTFSITDSNPDWVDKPTENYMVLNNIFKNKRQLHWSISRAENDREVTEQVVKEWMEMIKSCIRLNF